MDLLPASGQYRRLPGAYTYQMYQPAADSDASIDPTDLLGFVLPPVTGHMHHHSHHPLSKVAHAVAQPRLQHAYIPQVLCSQGRPAQQETVRLRIDRQKMLVASLLGSCDTISGPENCWPDLSVEYYAFRDKYPFSMIFRE